MRKRLFAAIAFAALAGAPALAAVIPVYAPQSPLYRVPPPRAYSWTGCYLGGHIGGSWVDKKLTGEFVDNGVVFGVPATFSLSEPSASIDSTGILAGGQLGCNLQFASNWVIGAEVNASGAIRQGAETSQHNIRTSFFDFPPGSITTVTASEFMTSKTDFIANATAKLGYTFGFYGRGMIYVKGGAAFARDKYEFGGQITCLVTGGAGCPILNALIPFNFTAAESRVGWIVGAGMEWALWDNWSVKFDYDYLDFGSRSVAFNDPFYGAANISIRQRINVVKIGVNYRLGPNPFSPTY